jgi:hypothetical protein
MPTDYLEKQYPGYPRHPYKNGQLSDGQLSDSSPYFVGFDTGDPGLGVNASNKPLAPMQALPGEDWHDVMTYCIKQWISNQTYTAIYNRLMDENKEEKRIELLAYLPASRGPGRAPIEYPDDRDRWSLGSTAIAQDAPHDAKGTKPATKMVTRDLVVVRATINQAAGSGNIAKVIRVARAMTSTSHDNAVRLCRILPNGQAPENVPMNVIPIASPPKGERMATATAVLPYVPGRAVLELFIGDKLVDQLQASLNAPKLERIDQPKAIGNSLRFSWKEAKDPDADTITYDVQMRFAENDPWRTVALDLTKPELSLPAERFQGVAVIHVRVIASDGYHSTAKESGALYLIHAHS